MADSVANRVVSRTKRKIVINSVFTIDGTEAADLALADKSAYTGPDGTEPGRFVIERIVWDLSGMTVLLEFEHDTDDPIGHFSGQGEIDYTQGGMYPGFVDPASTGGTGDIVATTLTTDAGDTGRITLFLRMKD